MLSASEAGLVLAMIRRHHGDAQIDAAEIGQFQAELAYALPDLTVREASDAVTRFYATTPGRWMGAADVAQIVRAERRKATPSEWQIGQECIRLGLNPDQAWEYRRQRLLRKPAGEAERAALTAGAPGSSAPVRTLASKPFVPDPSDPPERRGFIGRRRRGLSRAGSGMPPVGSMPDSAPSGPADGRTGQDPSADASQPSKPPQTTMEDPGGEGAEP